MSVDIGDGLPHAIRSVFVSFPRGKRPTKRDRPASADVALAQIV